MKLYPPELREVIYPDLKPNHDHFLPCLVIVVWADCFNVENSWLLVC